MAITDIMKDRLTISFETFPPKDDRPLEPILGVIDKLMEFKPDFISCTYGAGGTNKGQQSAILRYISSLDTHTMSNYTCINTKKADVKKIVDEYTGFGVDIFLALRGDFPKGQTTTGGDFNYGCQLISFIRENYPELTIAGGCYPEKHLNAVSMEQEAEIMLAKQDAGADFLVSQLCHDLDNYCRYMERARKAGVTLPVVFGLMPVLSPKATLSMALSNGCSIPRELAEIFGKYGEEPEDFKKAGKEFTVRQIERIVKEDIAGLHIFALNKYDDVADIYKASVLKDICAATVDIDRT